MTNDLTAIRASATKALGLQMPNAWMPQRILSLCDEVEAERARAEKAEADLAAAYDRGQRDMRDLAVEAIEDVFPGRLYASNRTRCIDAIRALKLNTDAQDAKGDLT